MLLVGMCNSAVKSIKRVVSPQILFNYTSEMNICFALELMFEYQNLNLTWIPIDPNMVAAKIIVCEFDLTFRSLTIYKDNPFISLLSENSSMTFMIDKVMEKNKSSLYTCDKSFFNDGHPVCNDGLDEWENNVYSRKLPCLISFFCETLNYKGDIRMSCIRKDQVSDGVIDCVNGKDESDCNECMETSV
jgi:hypothetical protein